MWYYPYSVIQFAVIANTIFVVGVYSVGLDLQRHFRRLEHLKKVLLAPDAVWAAAAQQFEEWKSATGDLLEGYFSLLAFGVFGIWWIYWFDQYNLSPKAVAVTRYALLFLTLPVAFLFFPILWGYADSFQKAERLVSASGIDYFRRHNGSMRFLFSTMVASRYFWIMAFFLVTGVPLWYLFYLIGFVR